MQGGLTKFRILFHCLLDGGQFTVSRSSAWIENARIAQGYTDVPGRQDITFFAVAARASL